MIKRTVLSVIFFAGCTTYRVREINITTEPPGALVLFNDSLVGVSPCAYQAKVPFESNWSCMNLNCFWSLFDYQPAAGDNYIYAYMNDSQQLKGAKILTNYELIKLDPDIHLFLEAQSAESIESGKPKLKKEILKYVRPHVFIYLFSYGGYLGYLRDNVGRQISFWGSSYNFPSFGSFINNSRWGLGMGFAKEWIYGEKTYTIAIPCKIFYTLKYTKRSLHLLDLEASILPDMWLGSINIAGFTVALDYTFVIRPPFPVEATFRVGHIRDSWDSGIQIGLGIHVGVGWWFTKKVTVRE